MLEKCSSFQAIQSKMAVQSFGTIIFRENNILEVLKFKFAQYSPLL
jgi:hypothetical protein